MGQEKNMFSVMMAGILEKLLWLYVILIPFMRVPALPLVGEKVQYSDAIFLVLFGLLVWLFLSGKNKLNKTPLLLSAVLMLVMFLPSFVNSPLWLKSFIEFTGISYLVALYFLLNQLVLSKEMWWRIVRLWVWIAFIISVTGIFAYILPYFGVKNVFLLARHDLLGGADPNLIFRLRSVFRHPGMLATYLHVSVVFASILIFKPKDRRANLLGYATVVLCFIAAFPTKARTNAGIAVTIFLILVLFQNKSIWAAIAKYAFFTYTLIMTVAVIVSTVWWIAPVKFYKNAGETRGGVEINLAYIPYFTHQKASFDMMRAHPIIGVGLGMYNYKSADYITWKEAKDAYRVIFPDITENDVDKYKRGIDPHSTYLAWAAEAGAAGLAAILWFLFQIGYALFKKMRTETDVLGRYIYGALLAGLAGFALNGFYIDILTMRHLWFMFGMAAVFMQVSAERRS